MPHNIITNNQELIRINGTNYILRCILFVGGLEALPTSPESAQGGSNHLVDESHRQQSFKTRPLFAPVPAAALSFPPLHLAL